MTELSDHLSNEELLEVADSHGATEARPTTGALIRLLGILAVIVGVFVALGAKDLLFVIAALIFMVLFHELGHFAVAKWSGMKVTEYFVGFGPRLWSVRRGETEYGVKAIPAGGYVRIIGMTSAEEVHPSDEPRAYRNQPFGKRIMVASAGSFMHFVLAFILAFFALTLIGRPDPSSVKIQGYLALSGNEKTPAQTAGLQPGDQIVAVNGKKVTSDATLTSAVHSHVGQPISISVDRDGTTVTKTVTPLDGRTVSVAGAPLAPANGPPKGFLGVELTQGTSTVGPLAAVQQSGSVIKTAAVGAVTGIVHLFSPAGISNYVHQVAHPVSTSSGSTASATTSSQSARPESIIGAVRTATQGAQAGMLTFLEVFISINIFVAVINMLPMLPLDGGHVVIAGYEWARTRRGKPRYRADVTKMMPVVYAFVAVLLLLVSTSMYLDIAHPAANPFH
jgi:membrane-associated protease RseP (regulator of RpoE activity)